MATLSYVLLEHSISGSFFRDYLKRQEADVEFTDVPSISIPDKGTIYLWKDALIYPIVDVKQVCEKLRLDYFDVIDKYAFHLKSL